jgi:hypothetical protein
LGILGENTMTTATSSTEVLTADEARGRDYKRMDLAALKYGLSLAFFKKLINGGRITRYKLGTATLIDCAELERLIVRDAGNHGAVKAPKISRDTASPRSTRTRRGSR